MGLNNGQAAPRLENSADSNAYAMLANLRQVRRYESPPVVLNRQMTS
jgi:hypothetical protein